MPRDVNGVFAPYHTIVSRALINNGEILAEDLDRVFADMGFAINDTHTRVELLNIINQAIEAAGLNDIVTDAELASVLEGYATNQTLTDAIAAEKHLETSYGEVVPEFTFQVPGDLSVAYNFNNGYYIRIGNRAFVDFKLSFTPTFTTSDGFAMLSGLPWLPLENTTIPVLDSTGVKNTNISQGIGIHASYNRHYCKMYERRPGGKFPIGTNYFTSGELIVLRYTGSYRIA